MHPFFLNNSIHIYSISYFPVLITLFEIITRYNNYNNFFIKQPKLLRCKYLERNKILTSPYSSTEEVSLFSIFLLKI